MLSATETRPVPRQPCVAEALLAIPTVFVRNWNEEPLAPELAQRLAYKVRPHGCPRRSVLAGIFAGYQDGGALLDDVPFVQREDGADDLSRDKAGAVFARGFCVKGLQKGRAA